MPKFFRFIDPNPDLTYQLRFDIRVGSGDRTHIVVDTGSKGIVIASSLVPEGSYTVMDPQPPAPVYSSSGNTYKGRWVLAKVEIIDRAGQSFITHNAVAVFACTDVPGVRMMGVGTRWSDPDDVWNPLLNLPEIASGEYRKGYILTRYGVSFGYTQQEADAFQVIAPSTLASPALATAELTLPTGASTATYAVSAPLLVDTGLPYMIVTPPNGQKPPAGYTDPASQQWINGLAVAVKLGDTPIWNFTTSATPAADQPSYGRFGLGTATSPGIINTGRHLLMKLDFLADVDGNQIGLRPATQPPA